MRIVCFLVLLLGVGASAEVYKPYDFYVHDQAARPIMQGICSQVMEEYLRCRFETGEDKSPIYLADAHPLPLTSHFPGPWQNHDEERVWWMSLIGSTVFGAIVVPGWSLAAAGFVDATVFGVLGGAAFGAVAGATAGLAGGLFHAAAWEAISKHTQKSHIPILQDTWIRRKHMFEIKLSNRDAEIVDMLSLRIADVSYQNKRERVLSHKEALPVFAYEVEKIYSLDWLDTAQINGFLVLHTEDNKSYLANLIKITRSNAPSHLAGYIWPLQGGQADRLSPERVKKIAGPACSRLLQDG